MGMQGFRLVMVYLVSIIKKRHSSCWDLNKRLVPHSSWFQIGWIHGVLSKAASAPDDGLDSIWSMNILTPLWTDIFFLVALNLIPRNTRLVHGEHFPVLLDPRYTWRSRILGDSIDTPFMYCSYSFWKFSLYDGSYLLCCKKPFRSSSGMQRALTHVAESFGSQLTVVSPTSDREADNSISRWLVEPNSCCVFNLI